MNKQTILFRLGYTEQYDPEQGLITWQDNIEKKWNRTYNRLQKGDTGLFLGSEKLYLGNLYEITPQTTLLFSEVETFDLSTDNFLRLNCISPEINSPAKGAFNPFILSKPIDISLLKKEVQRKEFVSFYICLDNETDKLLGQLNENDRVVTIGFNGNLKFIYQFRFNQLSTFEDFNTSLFGAKNSNLEELKAIHLKYEKTNTVRSIDRIKKGIKNTGFYKFNSFSEYYNVIHNKKIYKNLSDENEIEENENDVIIENPYMSNKNHLNQILYGPPGTGKTYATMEHALKIIENLTTESFKKKYKDRGTMRNQYKKYLASNQIAFVTFHQSYSYEDFIEGIKPVMPPEDSIGSDIDLDDDQECTLQYKIEPGIFKRIAEIAQNYKEFVETDGISWIKKPTENELNQRKFFKMSLGNTYEQGDNDVYSFCIKNNCIALGYGDNIDFTSAKTKAEIIKAYTDAGVKLKPRNDFRVSAVERFKFWMNQGDFVFISQGNHILRAIGRITGAYYFKETPEIHFCQFRPVEWLMIDQQIPIKEVSKSVFSQQTIYEMTPSKIKKEFLLAQGINKEEAANKKNHVLIIDEINRGNIASIFGELITLLEEDKRKGAKEELEAMLPYSKTPFTVPSNLFILGTMNSADRSVEALDTALRRRFAFEEILPKYNLLSTSSIYGRLWEANEGIGWGDKWKATEHEFFNLFGGKRIAEEAKYRKLEKLDWDKWQNAIESNEYVEFNGFRMDSFLRTLNERIEALLSRDHILGHSYLMEVYSWQDFIDIFYRNIIPLLQEYFYGDYGKIGLVIGAGFVKSKEVKQIAFASFEYDKEAFEEKLIYELVDYRKENVEHFVENNKVKIKIDFKKAINLLLNQAIV